MKILMKLIAWFGISVMLLAGMGWLIGSSTTTATTEAPPSVGDKRIEAIKQTFFVSQTRKGGFGSVLLLDGTLANQSSYDIRDPVITCRLVAPSGTSFGEVSTTLYERVAPGETLQIKDLNFGFVHSQAYGLGCKITDLRATPTYAPVVTAPPAEPKAPEPKAVVPVKSSKTKRAKPTA